MDIFEVKPPRQINITYDSREFLVQNFPHSWNTTNTRLPSGPAIMSFPFTPLGMSVIKTIILEQNVLFQIIQSC